MRLMHNNKLKRIKMSKKPQKNNINQLIRHIRMINGLNQHQLANEAGLTQSQISRIESGEAEPTLKFLAWFSDRFKVDVGAALSGTYVSPSDRVKALLHRDGMEPIDLAKRVGMQFAGAIHDAISGGEPTPELVSAIKLNYPELALWIDDGKGDIPKIVLREDSRGNGIPMVNGVDNGGGLIGAVSGVNADTLKRYVVPVSGAEIMVRIEGESMMPYCMPGGIAIARRIYQGDFIQWGRKYILDTKQGVLIKELQPSEKEGCVMCVSINAELFKPFEVRLNDLYSLWLVLHVINPV